MAYPTPIYIYIVAYVRLIVVESTTQAKEQMFELMIKVINQENKQQRFFGKHEKSLSTSDYGLMLFLKIQSKSF